MAEDDPEHALRLSARELLSCIDRELAHVDIERDSLRVLLRNVRSEICRLSADLWTAEVSVDLDGCIIGELREASKRVTGGNCTFADDDLAVLTHLADRAVKAGLTDKLSVSVKASIAEIGKAPAPQGSAQRSGANQ